MKKSYEGISIVLGGAAGTGIQTVEAIITEVLHRQGFAVAASKEYMSRIRGGSNSTEIRVAGISRPGYVEHIDICFPLEAASLRHLERRISERTVILGDVTKIGKTEHNITDVPLSRIAGELGNPLFANTVAAGTVLGLLGAPEDGIREYLGEHFGRKGDAVVAKNIQAALEGYQIGHHLAYIKGLHIDVPSRQTNRQPGMLWNGNTALGTGLLRGGINFLASYPMSPSTGILTFFSGRAHAFGLAVEQAEDEIAAINMGLGASYAGACSLVTTSGGGFALMEESVSLAGVIETPIVIHIAMRPGPGTGLPTRTEQGDFNLALYSGHGEFPRAIYAPGDVLEAFEVGQVAPRIADRYQSPVFILSDQYFLDAIAAVDPDDLQTVEWTPAIIETTKEYRRYEYTEDGISPRGVPGFGEGLVVVDSDEHTEDGHLTERLDVRVAMMDKRLKKGEGIRSEVLAPVVSGEEDAKTIVVGWGSTKAALVEAVRKVGDTGIRYVHFKQVWPLPDDVETVFRGADQIVIVENNATGQFADQLKLAGIPVTGRILKYDGEPFSVEELVDYLGKL